MVVLSSLPPLSGTEALVPQPSSDLWGPDSRQTSSWHLLLCCFFYLKWSERGEHSQYLAAFCYFLFTAKEYTCSSDPPLKRKQDKSTGKLPPWCDQMSSLSFHVCHGWPKHMDRNVAPRTTAKDVTGGSSQVRDCRNGWSMKKKDHVAPELNGVQAFLHLLYFKWTFYLTNFYHFQPL